MAFVSDVVSSHNSGDERLERLELALGLVQHRQHVFGPVNKIFRQIHGQVGFHNNTKHGGLLFNVCKETIQLASVGKVLETQRITAHIPAYQRNQKEDKQECETRTAAKMQVANQSQD